ncbi:MAG: DNA internalization-related competence protein ComEC/Rec2 [Gemmatimonadaceae bacterium]
MPLILRAAIVWAAGTAAGLSGLGGPAVIIALCAGTIVAIAVADDRGLAVAALALLGGTALLLGADVRAADARCLMDAQRATNWSVRLLDHAAPGSFVRATIRGDGCRVSVALAVASGEAPAGSTVRVTRAEPSSGDRGLLLRGARLAVERAPGPLDRWRNGVGVKLDALFGDDAAIVRALLIADTKGLSPAIRERYADAGLVHILSISGLHVAIVGGALLLLFEALRLSPVAARAAAVGVTALYVLAIGAPPPAARSATLFAVLAISRAAQRPVSPWGSYALGALIPLVDPRTVLNLGWQLSLAGYAAIIVSGRLSRRVVPERWRGWRRTVARDLMAGLLTTLATAPLVAWHFGRLSLVSPLSNIAAGPVVALLQPTLFLAMAMPFRGVAAFVADAAAPMLVALDGIAAMAAALPGAAMVVAPSAVAAVLSGIAASSLLAAGWARQWRPPLTVAVAAVALIAWMPATPLAADRGAEVHLLDVGQGDAIAIRSPAGRWVLVDAGRSWSSGDAGRSTVIPHLRRRGGPLAMLVLTHPHADHIGGAASVLRALRPAEVRDAAFVERSAGYLALLRTAHEVGTRWQRVRPGEVVELDGMSLEFLAPDSAWTTSLSDPNEASTVVRVQFGAVSFLLTGDAEAREEAWLLDHAAERLASDVLKVAHHGSATSTTPAFLSAVAPRLAVVSVGAGNTYGHPSSEVMRRLAAAGATVLRTDQLGTVVLRTDGARIEVVAAGHRWTAAQPLPEAP